jgi:hypothetical protein
MAQIAAVACNFRSNAGRQPDSQVWPGLRNPGWGRTDFAQE